MKRTLLVAAVAAAPLLAAQGAWAQLTISTSTSTPVSTATAVSGAPADVDITSSGSIGLTAAGTAVTVNSSNNVTNAGAIGATDIDNVTGIRVLGGYTSTITSTGTITLTETYAPTDNNADGLVNGDFASGGNRYGIVYAGGGTVTGGLVDTSVITVHGNGSYGIQIFGPITGALEMYQVTPASGSTVATITNGSISILGNNSVGLYVAPSGGVGGNVLITGINATGTGAQAAVIDGAVGGKVDVAGTVYATGFRSTTRSLVPALAALYTPDEITQGGSAVVVGGSVAGGVIVSAPPLVLSTTNLDLDNNGVPDTIQSTGTVTSYGSAPAIQIGDTGLTAVIGPSTAAAAYGGGYGLVIQGTVIGNGLFDQVTSPKIPGPIPATAIQVGAPGATVHVEGGLFNTGTIQAQAYQANATAIHVLGGATVDSILNNGVIVANVSQVSSAATGTGVIPQSSQAILIESGANVPTITNNSGILANITGAGGPATGNFAGAIIDRSGSLTTINNTGTIGAIFTQTQLSAPVLGELTAIDLSAGTTLQTLTQSVSTANTGAAAYNDTITYTAGQIVTENGVVYQAVTAAGVGVDPSLNPTIWRQIGATSPAISGNIYFGNGGSTINLYGGTIVAPVLNLGNGVNTINVNASSGATAILTGGLIDGGTGTFIANVVNGTLSDTNPAQIVARSVNVGANGVLLAAVNPASPTTANFVVTGTGANISNFANGAQVGITLASAQSVKSETYIVVQAAGSGSGYLNVGTFGSGATNIAPYFYTATTNYVPGTPTADAEITVTATIKSQAQLGFNNAEYAALPSVLQALPNNTAIQSAVLAQTTLAGLRPVYDQLLPAQGQGLFDALDKAAQSVSALTSTTPDAGTRVAGSSLWLQEVNERVRRTGVESQGSFSKLFGVVGGYERSGERGGAVGLTLAYYNDEETDAAQATGGNVVASLFEASAYYRRSMGGLTVAARGGGGLGVFDETRRFVEPSVEASANSSWNGYFIDGHFGVAYEHKLFGRYYARPELSADFLRLYEQAHNESSTSPGFALQLASRTSDRLSGQALMVLGAQFGKSAWLRTEFRGGYREVFAGEVGDTEANFTGGSVFSLAPDEEKGGWATIGLSIKGGSQFSYVALEGDADFRNGERRYDIRIAGRSIF